MADSEGIRENHEDIWDDDLVLKAYDKSIKLAKEDVAKRIARSTNTDPTQEPKVDTSAGERTLDWEPVSRTFKVGDFCRATYREDGIDYEAVVVSIKSDRCLIKFLGYGNEQYVKMADLLASWGEEFRTEQIERATNEEKDSSDEDMDSNASTLNTERNDEAWGVGRNKKRSARGRSRKSGQHLLCPPMPPMPPSMSGHDNQDSALHAMLMSWYMSGYYTGLYDAQNSRTKRNN